MTLDPNPEEKLLFAPFKQRNLNLLQQFSTYLLQLVKSKEYRRINPPALVALRALKAFGHRPSRISLPLHITTNICFMLPSFIIIYSLNGLEEE